MNPLMVFFIFTLFLTDIMVNQQKLTHIFSFLFFSYWIFYFFVKKCEYYDSSRKLQLASYSQSFDPSVYAKTKFILKNTKKFIEEQFNLNGKKITYTLFFTKVIAECLKLIPEGNIAIRFGKAMERGSTDIGVLVDMGGKDLSFVTLRDVANKKFETLYDEMYSKATRLKKGDDTEYKKQSLAAELLPSFLLGPILEITGILSNIGLSIKAFSITPNMFGSCLVSSVGAFKVDCAYAPLCPFTNTEAIFTLCAVKKSKKLQENGSYNENEYLPVNICLDHRYCDGAIGSKLIAKAQELFENPKLMGIY